MDQLLELDREWLLYLNGHHTPAMDSIMIMITTTEFWIPLYLLLIFLIIKKYKKESWIFLLGAAITILIADQFTSSFMKPYFARLRPSQDPALQGLIHTVDDYRGGMYGFASSHAANTFGTALFCWLLLHKDYNWMVFIFLWATIVAYSRIYLGVHYPGDILVGLTVGLLAGWASYKFSILLKKQLDLRKPIN